MKKILQGLITLLFLGGSLAYAGDYTNSAHGNSTIGVDRSSIDSKYSAYSNGNCAHCHEAHASLCGVEPEPDTGAVRLIQHIVC